MNSLSICFKGHVLHCIYYYRFPFVVVVDMVTSNFFDIYHSVFYYWRNYLNMVILVFSRAKMIVNSLFFLLNLSSRCSQKIYLFFEVDPKIPHSFSTIKFPPLFPKTSHPKSTYSLEAPREEKSGVVNNIFP